MSIWKPLLRTMLWSAIAAHASFAAQEFRIPPGGAPPLGSGPVTINGYVRVVDATSYEIYINGQQVGVKLVGIDAPAGNTPCGKLAAQAVRNLLKAVGPVKFDEDFAAAFDDRKLRRYDVSKAGQSIAAALVTAGVAQPNGEGKDAGTLRRMAEQTRLAGLGCFINGGKENSSAVQSSTDDELIPASIALKANPAADATATAAVAPAAAPQSNVVLPSGFTQDTIISGLFLPTTFTHLPDGRILIAQQNGIVRIYENGTLLATPFIDLSDRVNSFWDRGMIGMAADKDFATNGYVYLMYVYENDANDYTGTKTARLVRVTASGDTASPATETVILGKLTGATCHNFPDGADCLSADSQSHSVGNIKAAADGTLWATMGDGGSFNVVDDDSLRAQDIDSLNGKLLHITTAGEGVPSNPFWNGDPQANRSKVWATGMRNSFRFNMRPGTNTPYLGEVGWGTYDEINVGTPGANFGWPCYEGSYVQSGYEDKPVCQALYARGLNAVTFGITEWYHGGTSAAAVGGAFYTGTAYPPEYQGSYFYGDYAQNFIRNLRVDANNKLVAGPFDFASSADGPSQIEIGPDQNLYYLALVTGELRRIRYVASADSTPPAVVSTTPAAGSTTGSVVAALQVVFSEGMDPNSINASSLTLANQSTGGAIPATVTYNVADRTASVKPASNLANGTAYSLTVRSGSGGVADAAGNPLTANYTLNFSTVALPPAGTTFLSDLGSTSASNGWGPVERDQSNGDSGAGDGRSLTLQGTTYAKGIGVHAISDIRYSLGGSCTAFTATIGVDDETSNLGSVVFQVLTDGTKVYDSGTLLGGGATPAVNINLTGKSELALLVNDAGDGNSWDHGDWANAKITCSGGSAGAPIVASTNPANAATNVGITTNPSATFSKAMNAATITATTFLITKQGTSTPLAATVSYDSLTRTATLRPAANLQTGTAYTMTVKGGAGGVKDSNGNALVADGVWSFTTSTQSTYTRYLSDLTWTSSTNGWGPVEKDLSNGEDAAGDGRPIALRGTVFAKGLGTHANSSVTYNLGGACNSFSAVVGVDDEIGPYGSVVFQVLGDGAPLYSSGLVVGGGATKTANVNITGKNEVTLIVSDGGDGIGADHADWADAKVTCTVANTKPTPVIASPSSSLRYKVGDVINYSGSASDTEDGAIPASQLAWAIIIHHCPGGVCHNHPFLNTNGAGGSFVIPDHGDDSYFELQLTATDSAGLTNTASVSLQPTTVQITIRTNPSGLQVVYGGDRGVSPYTRTTIPGSAHSILASSPQGNLVFSSWSDGGLPQHNIVIGSTNVTYTANFVPSSTGLATKYVSDLSWASATNGLGPVERDKSNNTAAANDGRSLSLQGTVFAKGLGVAANSDIRFALGGACSNFSATVGVDDEVGASGSVTFSVLADGVQVFTSGIMRPSLQPQTLSVNLAGKNELALIVGDAGDGTASDHADWANALLTCNADTTPPAVSSRVPASNATGVAPTTSVSAAFSEAITRASVTGTSFTLMKQGSGTPVAATVVYDPQAKTALLAPGSPLTAGVYTATLAGGSGGIADLAGNPLVANVAWSFTVATGGGSQAGQFVSDLPWISSSNGWGPVERDRSNGELGASDGHPLSLRGTAFAKGLGAHAASEIRVNMAGACSTFTATVGVDDEVGPNGSVIFKVLADDAALFTSTTAVGGGAPQNVDVSVSGRNVLILQVSDGGDGNGSDHADWANAKLTCSGDTTAPTVTDLQPSDGATGINAASAVSATFSEAMMASSFTGSTVFITQAGSTTALPAPITYDSQANRVTLQPASPLTAGASFAVTVKGGASGVRDLAGNALAADRTWSFTVNATAQVTKYISDLPWTSSANGWGPVERDKSNGEDVGGDGNTITLNGTTYTKGLGAHASSSVKLALNGACSNFAAIVGVDNEIVPNGSIVFTVLADGISIYNSGILTGSSLAKPVDVSVAGRNVLELQISDGGDGIGADHGDWANARVNCNPDATPPTVSNTTPVSGATNVAPGVTVKAVFSKPIVAASLTNSTFALMKQGTTTKVAAVISYDPQTMTASLKPNAALSAATIYAATLSGGASGVKDLSGNALSSTKTWNFTTR